MIEQTQFGVCKMTYKGGLVTSDLPAVLLQNEHYKQYKSIVDEAFYQMRKELNIRPFDKHSFTLMDLEGLRQNCFILLNGEEIVCGVTCGDGEIDGVVVNPKYQGRGYGRKITEFALAELQRRGADDITLSVTKWNSRAITLYEDMGFEITKEVIARGVNTRDENGSWFFEFKGEGAEIMVR